MKLVMIVIEIQAMDVIPRAVSKKVESVKANLLAVMVSAETALLSTVKDAMTEISNL